MKNRTKHIEKINKVKLIEKICDVTAIPHNQVSAVLGSLEKNVFNMLSSASDRQNDYSTRKIECFWQDYKAA